MSELAVFISQRKVLRKKVTECYNRSERYDSFSASQKQTERSLLSSYKADLHDIDAKILRLKFSDDVRESDLDDAVTACQEYKDKIECCLALLEDRRSTASYNGNVRDAARSLLKQPTAPLPKFNSAKNEDLLRFFTEFESTTGAYNYPDRDLLLLLKQQVEGRGKILLDSLEADKQSFKDAKDLLISAFASGEMRKFCSIRQLTEIKLNKGDDPFVFISQLRNICESVKVLKLTSDDFLQYFAWSGLEERFKVELVQITGKTHPSIQDILDNFFIACERYDNYRKIKFSQSNDPKSNPDKITSLAVKVKPEQKGFYSCSLCSEDCGHDADHVLHKCKKFATKQSKLDKLKALNGCQKCGNIKHPTDKCRFKFKRRCVYCSQWHFDFLCGKISPSEVSQSKANSSSEVSEQVTRTNSGVAVLPAVGGHSVLPTFTFTIPGKNKLYRCIKDSGSQNTFISKELCEHNNFKTVKENLTLTVNGFNGSKNYKTKVVEVCIEVGTEAFKIPAIVTPEIEVQLSLPLLGTIVDSFKSKGYKFADLLLSDETREISGIDMLLGTDAVHCIIGKDVLFGRHNPSVYIETPVGVMLVGNINHLAENLPFLPACNVSEFFHSLPVTTPAVSDDLPMNLNTHSFLCNDYIVPMIDEEIHDLQYESLLTNCSFSVLSRGKLIESKLEEATNQILEVECRNYYNYDHNIYNDQTKELDGKLVDFTLKNISREDDGRIQVPLLWNGEVSHLLSHNEQIAKIILKSNLKKLRKNEEHLFLMDDTIKEQLSAGIIEPIHNLAQFKVEHPYYSFMPHMGIFKLQRETTKCRVVFLSNLKQDEPDKKLSLSHNQVMHSGPTLNQKLSSAFVHLRFDEKLLIYDLKKAFNMLSLKEADQAKLLFFWYRNVRKGDFTIVAYKNVRLSFGLRCSPFLLMITLYYILVLLTVADTQVAEMKKLMYALMYMDNGAFSSMDSEILNWAYTQLPIIFHPFKFQVQQLFTNDVLLQARIDDEMNTETPPTCNLLGLTWDRISDVIFTRPINLNVEANTKRSVLKTIAAQFDLFGFNMPILNRSRLFMHMLQCKQDLGWDKVLSPDIQRQWKNISKQANASSLLKIDRFVGPRDGTYRILAFTDASHVLYGTVLYLEHVESGNLSFIQAKNRMINPQLKTKSIPALEINAIGLGVETLMELHRDLAGPFCVKPIKITELVLFTDSTCSLHWLHSSTFKMDKMQKRTAFVMNRINSIQKLCERFPVKFCFISGKSNPADCVTRCLSHKQLLKSTYLRGPSWRSNDQDDSDMVFFIPNPLTQEEIGECNEGIRQVSVDSQNTSVNYSCQTGEIDHLIALDKFSSFHKLVLIYRRVLSCFEKWKLKAGISSKKLTSNLFAEASKRIIVVEQMRHFPEIFSYFSKSSSNVKDIPNLVNQLNIFLDHGVLRVKSKFKKWRGEDNNFPILLPRNSTLTELIVMDVHSKLAHSGCYSVLAELRNHFYIPKHFSTIKKLLKQCVHCRRFNNRTFKLNQNAYREFRSDPPRIPFAYVFIDHIGPFSISKQNVTHKVWLLCFACTWTRAINLKICHDLSVKEFLRSFQLHCFDYGIPQLCVSDLGSQLTAGANIITNFISDPDTQQYFEENNVKALKFQQYFKGCSKLGSLVEVCVKMVKRLLFGSIKNMVLSYHDFEFLVCHTVHLANRRPIAFKESLREADTDAIPEPITPEHLIKGYQLTSLNIIPDLHGIPDDDPEWNSDLNPAQCIQNEYNKLRKVKNSLLDIYHSEFLGTLIAQAVDKKDKYRPVVQHNLKVGDIVLLKEANTKPNNYPLAMVKNLEHNTNDEITGAIVFKGKTKELVKRHVTTMIPFLEINPDYRDPPDLTMKVDENLMTSPRVRRKAAVASEQRTRQMLQ